MSVTAISKLYQNLEEMVSFLSDFLWLHNFPMIEVVSTNSFDNIPSDWKLWFMEMEMNVEKALLCCLHPQNVQCASLSCFIMKCEKFSIKNLIQCQDLQDCLSFNTFSDLESQGNDEPEEKQIWKILKKVSPKKKHEIECLSKFMRVITEVSKSELVCDIGSGMGYLHPYLLMVNRFRILGVEQSLQNIEGAKKLTFQCVQHSCNNVQYEHWHMEDNSTCFEHFHDRLLKFVSSDYCQCEFSLTNRNLNIKSNYPLPENLESSEDKSKSDIVEKNTDSLNVVCEKFKQTSINREGETDVENGDVSNKGVNVISLHSCADLSPIMLKCTLSSSLVQSLLMISCCYHKMNPQLTTKAKSEVEHASSDEFMNFPLSQSLSQIMSKENLKFNTSSLRLASEESIQHWEYRSKGALQIDVNAIAFRAILHSVCKKDNVKMVKKVRNWNKKSSCTNFDEYLELVFRRCIFENSEGKKLSESELTKFHQNLNFEFSNSKDKIGLVGLIRILQLSLQPVLESLILLDRLVYLKEMGVQRSGIIQLFDERISPRNTAIFAFK